MGKRNDMKTEAIKHRCIKTWLSKDGRLIFEAGKSYNQFHSSDFAITGEGGITMWMDNDLYATYFLTFNSK